jgi:D-3-phosphoglycerate dehydrogenase
MFRIQTLSKISTAGLDILPRDRYEIASEIPNPDAIIVRSTNLNSMKFPPSLKSVARAGTGVNNIPVSRCNELGIVVFNTPGANANSVKELVLAALFIASRNIIQGINWAKTLVGKGDSIPALVEEGKSQFAGPEIKGKTLGIIGLGAIGVMVANDAVSLGMKVRGYDPFISVESAWGLSSSVQRAMGLEALIRECDYITINAPLTEKTKGMIGREQFAAMKKGVALLNLARGGLVNNAALGEAIRAGTVSCYVTDFPDEDLLRMPRVIAIPHLGASTPEAEDNCAVMAIEQTREYLEQGNVVNSVNFPDCHMDRAGVARIVIANRNIPAMVGQITTVLAEERTNISDMLNRHKDELAYTMIDVDEPINEKSIEKIRQITGVIRVRVISGNGQR